VRKQVPLLPAFLHTLRRGRRNGQEASSPAEKDRTGKPKSPARECSNINAHSQTFQRPGGALSLRDVMTERKQLEVTDRRCRPLS